MKRTLLATALVAACHLGTPAWANGIDIGSLTLDGTLNSASDSASSQIWTTEPTALPLGLNVTGTIPKFNLGGYKLTDVFASFTLSNHSTATITSLGYDPDQINGNLLVVSGNLGASVARVNISDKVFNFAGGPDFDGCQQGIFPNETIACGAASVFESGSLSFDLNDDLSPFIGFGTVDILGLGGAALTYWSDFAFPIEGRVDGTIAFDALSVHYGYVCLSDLSNLDACAGGGGNGNGGNGTIPEPASLALFGGGVMAMLAARRRRLLR